MYAEELGPAEGFLFKRHQQEGLQQEQKKMQIWGISHRLDQRFAPRLEDTWNSRRVDIYRASTTRMHTPATTATLFTSATVSVCGC